VIVRDFVPARGGSAPPITNDPPRHQNARRALLPAFTPAAVDRVVPRTREICNVLIDAILAREDGRSEAAVDSATCVVGQLLQARYDDGTILADGERAPIERLSLGVAALVAVEIGLPHHACCCISVIFTPSGPGQLQGSHCQRHGLRILASPTKLYKALVDRSQFIRSLLRVCWSTKAEHYERSEAQPAGQGDAYGGHLAVHTVAVQSSVLPPHCGGGQLRRHRQPRISIFVATTLQRWAELRFGPTPLTNAHLLLHQMAHPG